VIGKVGGAAHLVVVPGDLAERIRAAHEAAQAGARTALENAILCGELLLEAKRAVGHGGFLPWLAANTSLSPRQAQKYMRLFRRRDTLANAPPGTHLTAAIGLLAQPRDEAEARPALPWCGAVEWYTPRDYVEAARTVLDKIDLDPASNALAQETVGAAEFYTAETDGLARPWRGRVWLNPPYRGDLIARFVDKLLAEHEAGNVPEAVLLVHARTDVGWFHEAARVAGAVCFTRGRISFRTPEGTGDSPTTGSAFLYFGDAPDRFAGTFAGFGLVFFNPRRVETARPIRLEMAA
jgi:phage N-6-adenine-methyltransferase